MLMHVSTAAINENAWTCHHKWQVQMLKHVSITEASKMFEYRSIAAARRNPWKHISTSAISNIWETTEARKQVYRLWHENNLEISRRKNASAQHTSSSSSKKTGNVRIKCNTEARSRNHGCRGKAESITHSQRVFVVIVIQYVTRMRHIILSPVACLVLSYFFHIIS
jgi:hypothetical protein